jgi:hypothetical protein
MADVAPQMAQAAPMRWVAFRTVYGFVEILPSVGKLLLKHAELQHSTAPRASITLVADG